MIYATTGLFVIAGGFIGALGAWLLRSLTRPAAVSFPWSVGLAGLAWALVGWRWASGSLPDAWLLVLLALTSWLIPLSLADLKHRRLPNALTLSAYPTLACGLVVYAWNAHHDATGLISRILISALIFAVFFAGAHLISPSCLGAGDVKLAPALAAVLGAVGWVALMVATLLSAIFTLVLAVVLAIAMPGRSARGSLDAQRRLGVPYGPGLLGSTWLIALFPQVFSASFA
jgi:leader peptidase (prepilin peptidase)/N-methyltransferase